MMPYAGGMATIPAITPEAVGGARRLESGAGEQHSTEYSWVRACLLCGGCEFQRMGGGARPRDDAAVAGWYFGAD